MDRDYEKKKVVMGLESLKEKFKGRASMDRLIIEDAIGYIEKVPHTYGEEASIKAIACFGCEHGGFCSKPLDLEDFRCKGAYARAKVLYENEIKVGYYR